METPGSFFSKLFSGVMRTRIFRMFGRFVFTRQKASQASGLRERGRYRFPPRLGRNCGGQEQCRSGQGPPEAWPPAPAAAGRGATRRPDSPAEAAGRGRRPRPAPWGQEEGERLAQLTPQQGRGARLSPSRLLLGWPCGDRWLLGKCRPPSEHPQACQPRVSQPHSIKNSRKRFAFLHLTFSGLKVWRNRAAGSL